MLNLLLMTYLLLLASNDLFSMPRAYTMASLSSVETLVLVILVALALSVSAHRKQYTLYVRNLINKQGRVMNYDTESTSAWANVFLWFAVVSSYVLLLMTDPILFPFLFIIIAVYFGLKWVLIKFMGYVFGNKDAAQAFLTDYFVIIALLGLMLLPVAFARINMPEVPDLVWNILLSIMGVLVLIILFIKLLQIFYTKISSLFYIFLYLCASEILPLFVAAKVVSDVAISM